MYGGEIVGKNPFKNNFHLENLWSKRESKTRSKTKLDLENLHQCSFFDIVKKIPLKENLDLENLWSNTESKTESKKRSKTNLDLEKFYQFIFFCRKP